MPSRNTRATPKNACLTFALLFWGCGGSHTYGSGHFEDDEASYWVSSPGDRWKRLSAGDVDLAWAREGAVIQVNASCKRGLDIPLQALTHHLLVGFTERQLHAQKRVTVDRREALHTHLSAKLDGVPRSMALHVLKKDGCVYDMSLVAAPGSTFDACMRDYRTVVSSFTTRGHPR